MEPVRQHYLLATGGGVQPPPNPNPKPNFVGPGNDKGTIGAPKSDLTLKKGPGK